MGGGIRVSRPSHRYWPNCRLGPLPNSLLSLTPKQFVEITMAGGPYVVSPWLRIKHSQPAMSCRQTWKHRQRCFKCQYGSLALSQPCQCDSQVEVTKRRKVLQAHGEQSFGSGIVKTTLPQVHRR